MSNTITQRMQIIKDLTNDLNVLKEQYDEALEQDPNYQDSQEELKEVKEKSRQTREKVMQNSTLQEIEKTIKEIRQEIKENKDVLSHELVEYYKETGSLEIEDADGNIRKLKFSVSLTN